MAGAMMTAGRVPFRARVVEHLSTASAGAFMNGLNKFLAATFLSAAMLFTSGAQAMDIIQFDQMTNQDRQAFLDSLSRDAETVLEQQGRSADAQKVHQLFNDIRPGDNLPVGDAELELNLANARVRDDEKHIQNPDAPRVQVETALISTLRKNGIEISTDFIKDLFQLTGTFQPKLPPQTKDVKKKDDKKKN
jgi:hypothetical protein